MPDFELRYLLLGALAIALLYAAFTDLKRRQIDNWLNGAIALAAPLYWWAAGFTLVDIGWQLGLTLAAFAGFAVLFAMRAMGGGDVKLLAALALWVKPAAYLKLLIIMALLGGLLTMLFGAWHVMRRQRHKLAIPYGVAIASAGIWTIAAQFSHVVTLTNLGTGLG